MSQRIIENYLGEKIAVKCIGCLHNEQGDSAPGMVKVTQLFHVHQDFEVPIPGFVIVATRRHVTSIDEFTDDEAKEFVDTIRHIRRAMRETLGIENVYLIQEEDTEDHFHLWMLPRYEWMQDEQRFGRKVSSARTVLDYAKQHMKTPENVELVESLIVKLRDALNK